MNKVILIVSAFSLCLSAPAQIGLGNIKNKIGSVDIKHNTLFPASYYSKNSVLLSNLITTKFSDHVERVEKAAVQLNIDSLKLAAEYGKKNLKKFSDSEKQSVENFLNTYSSFNQNFENSNLKAATELGTRNYSSVSSYSKSTFMEFTNSKKVLTLSRKMYSGISDVDKAIAGIEAKQKEYGTVLAAKNIIVCSEQLDVFGQIRLSAGKASECIKGVQNGALPDVTQTGLYVNVCTLGEYKALTFSVYINDVLCREISVHEDDLKTEKGWAMFQLLPGLNDFSERSVYILNDLKDKLSNGCKITLKSSNLQEGICQYSLSSFKGSVSEFAKKAKETWLKSVQLPTSGFKDPVMEKDALLAYAKWEQQNKELSKGPAHKANIYDKDWTITRNKIDIITGRKKTVYFAIKGKDGYCYYAEAELFQEYISLGKFDTAVRLNGAPISVKKIHCDNVK
ncbi:MAG TPA: hypothetical protein VGF30_07420 [Bacteroidia bacterium]